MRLKPHQLVASVDDVDQYLAKQIVFGWLGRRSGSNQIGVVRLQGSAALERISVDAYISRRHENFASNRSAGCSGWTSSVFVEVMNEMLQQANPATVEIRTS
jgi:hypothetical protein